MCTRTHKNKENGRIVPLGHHNILYRPKTKLNRNNTHWKMHLNAGQRQHRQQNENKLKCKNEHTASREEYYYRIAFVLYSSDCETNTYTYVCAVQKRWRDALKLLLLSESHMPPWNSSANAVRKSKWPQVVYYRSICWASSHA